MKVFITGGLGFVGKKLSGRLHAGGHQVTVMGRHAGGVTGSSGGIREIAADASKPGSWQDTLAEHDTIINLAGVSIFTRWTEKKKDEIYRSRIDITRNVVEGIKKRKGEPTDFISTSAVGFYGFHGDEELTESDIPGDDFLARVCREWEAEALKAADSGARVVLARFGIVLGRQGGAMDLLSRIFRMRLGGRLGSGRQWFSWIHEDDLAAIFMFLLENKTLSGAVNCTAPRPVTNGELTKALNTALGTFPLVPPAPGFVLRIVMGEFGDFILRGQRAIPSRLRDAGFTFSFPDIESALADLAGPGGKKAR